MFTSTNYESVWLELSVGVNNEKISLGLIYHQSGNSIREFTIQFSEFLFMNNILKDKDVCIFSEININSILRYQDSSFTNYLHEICNFGFTNRIDVPTRVNN